MKIFKDASTYNWEKVVVTTGTFDGLHRGHRYLLSELKRAAEAQNAKSVVVTFEPHPRIVLDPENSSLRLLTSPAEKVHLFEEMGIDGLFIIPFDIDFSKKTTKGFFKEYIVDMLHTSTYVIGYDHRVGNKRSAKDIAYEHLGAEFGISVDRVDAASEDDKVFSSSRVREMLEGGRLKEANSLLGYSYLLAGTVVRGNQLGRKIGFPTANLKPDNALKLTPKEGVYAVYVHIGTKKYKGVLNIGSRPTVSADTLKQTIEVHIVDFTGDIYNETVMVSFEHRLRDEQRFDGLTELKEQIAKDKTLAKELLTC